MRSRILGTGSYVPKQVLTNGDIEQLVDTSDAWIVERTGIRERRKAAPGEACSDLGVQAGQQALSAAHIQAADLDLIIVATCTGDSPLPSTASLIQYRLGAARAAAFDISAACCGFVQQVQSDRQAEIQGERDDGCYGERIADPSAEHRVGAAAARAAEGARQPAALRTLYEDDQHHRQGDQHKEECHDPERSTHGVFASRFCLIGPGRSLNDSLELG